MNHCFEKTEIYALELEILFANIFANQHLFKTTLDTKLFNPFLQWTRHVMWLFGNCPQTSTFCNIFRSYLRQVSNFHIFLIICDHCGIKTVDIYALSVRVVIINCQDFYPFQDWEDYLPISNFKFLVFLRAFYAVGLPMSRQDQIDGIGIFFEF